MRTISRAQAEREADGRLRPQEGDCLCYRERKAYYKVPATGGKRLFGNADGFFYTREVPVADEFFMREKFRLLISFFYTREVPVADGFFYTREVPVADGFY